MVDRGEIDKIARIPSANVKENDNKNQYNIGAVRAVANCICLVLSAAAAIHSQANCHKHYHATKDENARLS
jgi:hypothetical protein